MIFATYSSMDKTRVSKDKEYIALQSLDSPKCDRKKVANIPRLGNDPLQNLELISRTKNQR